MDKIIIHTCKQRKWYVDGFLIPSLRLQGIDDVVIYNDEDGAGQLTSFINSYDVIGDEDAWHLQDDIIISSKFREQAEKYKDGIVCGFCNKYSRGNPGYVSLYNMWYSMPCIRIPGHIFKEFISWLKRADTQKKLRYFFEENKHDDVFFEIFLTQNYPNVLVHNVAPNMVNHIDHLLGGSIINKERNEDTPYIMSTYWDEPDLLIDVENKLKERSGTNETD